jgi:Xaa-Pro aminopeptidase
MTHAHTLVDVDRLRAALADASQDAVVATSERNVHYLATFAGFDYLIEPETTSYAVVPADPGREPELVASMSERLLLRYAPSWITRVRCFGTYHIVGAPTYDGAQYATRHDALAGSLSDLGLAAGRVGFELELLPGRDLDELRTRLPQLDVVDASPLLRCLRMQKTSVEISRLRCATEITERAIDDAFAQLRAGMTEQELAHVIASGITARGGHLVYCQVGYNGHGAMGVVYPTDRPLARGDLVRVDVSARYQGYHSDLGRNCAMQAAVGAVRPGASAGDVFATAMAVPREMGMPEFQRHHVGHGIGLQAHEAPFLRPNASEIIQPGMVLALEAPFYVYDRFAFSPEDIGVVTPTGFELFSHAPAALPEVG